MKKQQPHHEIMRKNARIIGLMLLLAAAAGCQTQTVQQSAITDLAVERGKLPSVHAVGWIQQVNSQIVDYDSSGKPASSEGWTKDYVLRCSDGHDYLLFFLPDTVMPATFTCNNKDSIYRIDGGVGITPDRYLNRFGISNMIRPGVNTPEKRDVTHMILVRSMQKL